MQITALEEYGLRCVLTIARHHAPEPMTITAIAHAEGLSKQYIAKLLNRLHHAGIVQSSRGPSGGFHLARPATKITVADCMDAMGGTVSSRRRHKAFCETFAGNRKECAHLGNCSVRPMWTVLMRYIREVLRTLSIHDLINEETQAAKQVAEHFHAAAIKFNEPPIAGTSAQCAC